MRIGESPFRSGIMGGSAGGVPGRCSAGRAGSATSKGDGSMSIASRAFLALLLTVGFYLLAFGIAVGLVAAVVLEITVAHRVSARLDFFALGGAAVILWSI